MKSDSTTQMVYFNTITAIVILFATILTITKPSYAAEQNVSFRLKWSSDDLTQDRLNVRTDLKRLVESELKQTFAGVQKKLRDPEIIKAVKEANVKHLNISREEIRRLDRTWQNEKTEAGLVTEVTKAPCSKILKRLQGTNREYAEIFVTDAKGLNVCATNKTTDYYQADEEWWKTAAQGKTSHGGIAYDESAKTFAVGTYIPIVDTEKNKVIGVAKALLRVSKKLRGKI